MNNTDRSYQLIRNIDVYYSRLTMVLIIPWARPFDVGIGPNFRKLIHGPNFLSPGRSIRNPGGHLSLCVYSFLCPERTLTA